MNQNKSLPQVVDARHSCFSQEKDLRKYSRPITGESVSTYLELVRGYGSPVNAVRGVQGTVTGDSKGTILNPGRGDLTGRSVGSGLPNIS